MTTRQKPQPTAHDQAAPQPLAGHGSAAGDGNHPDPRLENPIADSQTRSRQPASAQGGNPLPPCQPGGDPTPPRQPGGDPGRDLAPARQPGGDPAPPGHPASAAGGPPRTRPAPLRAKVWFVGAGPGAADLLTLRAARVIAAADVVVWASSLVHPSVLEHASPAAEIVDSARLPLEGVRALYDRALAEDLVVARVHSGDPALWGAVAEQRDLCDQLGLPHETVPGVSAYSAVAAITGRELTVPEVAQSVILTRLGGGKTPMPSGEGMAGFARHGTTLAVFLSAARSGQLQAELLAGGYPPGTPAILAYRATWPDELIVECTVGTLADTVRARKLWKHTLFLVGPALAAHGTRSHLYHPGHFHGFRRADPQARHALRERTP